MDTIDRIRGIDPKAKAELQDVCDRVSQGIRDPEAARKAIARMNTMREELRQRIGVQNIAVDLVRQTRDSR